MCINKITAMCKNLAPRTNRPDCFYKYGSFKNDPSLERLSDVILNGRLYFSSPAQFNDPFDMRPGISVDIRSLEFRNDYFSFFDKYLKNTHHVYSYRKRQKVIGSEYRKLLNGPTIQERYREYLSKRGICCMSANSNSLLMWAHYADGHNGFCLEFDSNLWNDKDNKDDKTKIIKPVVYQREYPMVDIWKMLKDSIRDGGVDDEKMEETGNITELRKSSDWAYEMEWRAASAAPGFNNYQPGSLKKITLGANVRSETEGMVRTIIDRQNKPIALYKANLSATAYELIYVEA